MPEFSRIIRIGIPLLLYWTTQTIIFVIGGILVLLFIGSIGYFAYMLTIDICKDLYTSVKIEDLTFLLVGASIVFFATYSYIYYISRKED